jgi:UDP-glucose 4-epimerase
MKKILITGAHSYVGTSFENWMQQYENYQIDTLDMLDENWKETSFSGYDVVFHVAGLAHADITSVSKEIQDKYYLVNCDLAIETAQKAKNDGVKQFIFMSSMSIYGDSARVGKIKAISQNTQAVPSNFYGDSKLKAEKGMLKLRDDAFKVVIIRPPMVYGYGSKGNFPTLEKLAATMPIFPTVKNQRSMIFVNNLCEFVHLSIERECDGIYYPQNEEYVCTVDMVRQIAMESHKKIWFTGLFNWGIYLLSTIPGKIGKYTNKAFGSLIYEFELSSKDIDISEYQTVGFAESIRLAKTGEQSLR